MISQKKVAVLTAALLVPVLLIVASAALAQEPVFIQKSDSPDPVYAGEELFYEIFITPPDTGLWWITDTLPPEVTYISDTLEPIPLPGGTYVFTEGCHLVGNELGCMLYGSEWEPRSFQIKTRVAPNAVADLDTGTVVANNVAWLADYDPVDGPGGPGPFAAEGTFIEDLADLAVIKMSKPDTHVPAGKTFEYTIFVDNFGPSYARDVRLTDDILSSGTLTLVTWTDDPARDDTCSLAGTTISCSLNNPLEPVGTAGGTGRWVIKVQVSADETQDVNNLVQVFTSEGGTPDPDMSNNQATDFIYVTDVADLSVHKYLDDCWYDGFNGDGGCVAGGMAEFELEVYNDGPSTAENVVVEDLLPAGVTVVDVSGDGSCTTGIPGDPLAPLTCNLGDIPPGEWRYIYIDVEIDPDYVDAELPSDYRELENDVWVYSDIFDPDNSDNRDHVIVPVFSLSMMGVSKNDDRDPVMAGEVLEYGIGIFNDGPSTARNVYFWDVPPTPQYVTFLGYEIGNGAGSCFYQATYNEVDCYLGDIAPGTFREVYLRFLVDPSTPNGQMLHNSLLVFGDSPLEFNEAADRDEDTTVQAEADLSIEKTSEPPKIYPGEQKVYHIEVTNDGPSDAESVVVSDTLPIELTYQIDTDNCDLVGGPPDLLMCNLGAIPAGESVQFDIHALVDPDYPVTQTVEITNTAEVSMETEEVWDPNLENNDDWTTNLILPPNAADLEIYKDYDCWMPDDGDPPPDPNGDGPLCVAGGIVGFYLDVYNFGPVPAQNVVVEDLVPEGVTVVDVCIDPDAAGPEEPVCLWGEFGEPGYVPCTTGIPGDPDAPLTCNLGTLPVDQSVGVEIYGLIDQDYANPDVADGMDPEFGPVRVMENDALVYSDHFDPNNDNNRSAALLDVWTYSEVYMNKIGPNRALAGEEITYIIRVRNDGPSTLSNFHFDDRLPFTGPPPQPLVTYVGYDIPDGSGHCILTEQQIGPPLPIVRCWFDELPQGDYQAVHLTVRVNPDVDHMTLIRNDITRWGADSYVGDVYGPPRWDWWETRVINQADLSVWKEAEPWKVYAGEQIRYDIEVTNNGPGVAWDVFLTDTLPSSVTYELATIEDCYPLNGQVECYFEGIGPGESRNFSIFARVDPGADPGTVSNRADLYSETTYDPIDYNDWNTAPNYIQGKADLKVTKFGKPDGEVRADQQLIYTVVVDNLGTGYAHDVVLRDILKSNGTFDLVSVTPDRDADCDPMSGTYTNTLELTCSLTDTLDVMTSEPGSGRWIVTVVVEAAEPQSINNVAHVVLSHFDPDLSNNQAIAEHDITAVANLALEKVAWGEVLVGCKTDLWKDHVAAGGTLTYTLTVTNTGPSTAENVVLRDQPLPSLLEIDLQSINIKPSEGNCLTANIGPPDYLLTCNLGTLGPGLTATVEFTATVPPWVPDGTLLVNDSMVYSDMFDNDTGNSIVSNHTIVSTLADLKVEKTQDEIALPGLEVTYSITVTNLGPSDAHGVMISDTLPFNPTTMTMECCASDGGDCDVECEVPTCPHRECPWPEVDFIAQADIPAGGLVIYTLTATPEWVPCEMITNTVEIYAGIDPDYVDPCPGNDVDHSESDPECNFVPLALKDYPAPDTTP